MMNDEKFHKDVDDIEFKCNELISEINDHLTLYREPQLTITTFDNQEDISSDPENILPNEVVTTCHNKLINFELNRCKATKSSESKNTNTVRIHIPKNLCCNLTKINQLLTPHTCDLIDDHTDSLDVHLEVRHLKHVNIDPCLTKQIAFKVSCPDERSGKLIKNNVGTFNVIHDDGSILKTSILKQERTLKSEKNPSGDNFDELEKSNEENINSEINISVESPSKKVRHFLFGNIHKSSSSSPTNKRSIKMYKNKIKLKKNVIE